MDTFQILIWIGGTYVLPKIFHQNVPNTKEKEIPILP